MPGKVNDNARSGNLLAEMRLTADVYARQRSDFARIEEQRLGSARERYRTLSRHCVLSICRILTPGTRSGL